MRDPAAAHLWTPQDWAKLFPVRPVLESGRAILKDGLLQRWTATDPTTRQPRLDHHNIALHLGGAKHVCREGEGCRTNVDVELGAVSVVPSGASFIWTTRGPVDFAHLYVEPKYLDRVIAEEFDRDPAAVALQDSVGRSDPLLRTLYEGIMDEIAAPGPLGKVCVGALYHAFLVRLLCSHSNLSKATARARHALAPYRLRRVTDYIKQNLPEEIALTTLAQVAGLSRFHFSRAFRQATGMAPHAFIVHLRILEAKRLLRERKLTIAEVASACGFNDSAQFATSFRKATGQSPSSYRGGY